MGVQVRMLKCKLEMTAVVAVVDLREGMAATFML